MKLEMFSYFYIKKDVSKFDYFILFKIYLPLLNFESLMLYWNLLLTYKSDDENNKKNKPDLLNDFLISSNLSVAQFINAKNKLEELNLLKIVIDENKKILYFELFNPEPHNLKEKKSIISILFQNKMGFEKADIVLNQINNFLNFSKENEIVVLKDKKNVFNFDELTEKIVFNTGISLSFSNECKEIINNFFSSNSLTTNEIEKCIYNSIIKNNDNFLISEKLLDNELLLLTNSFNTINITKQAMLNSNKNIFLEKLCINDLNLIFNKYKDMKSEQFASILLNRDINWKEEKIIEKIRENSLLPDFLINIILDYSILKTYGNLNEKYLLKVSNSFTNKEIVSLEDAYNYLSFDKSKKAKYFSKYDEKNNIIKSKNGLNNNFDLLKNNDSQDDAVVDIEW